jgi:hypothetical protein
MKHVLCVDVPYVKTCSIDVPFNLCGFDELVVFVNLDLSIYVLVSFPCIHKKLTMMRSGTKEC